MTGWSWHAGTLTYRQRCVHCQQSLRIQSDGVVKWVDGELYHVGCLLDRQAAYQQPPATASAERDVSYMYGLMGGAYP